MLSFIIPAYNEEANLPRLFERVGAVADGLRERCRCEMILLDNCSRDRTGELAVVQCARDARWKYVRYSRNFGAEGSLMAGLDFARGDAVINLFSDLQDPPELIPQMLDEWEKGADVVYGVVRERNDSSKLKTLGARVAYWLINLLADCNIPRNATDFRLMDRKVVLTLRALREPDRYMRGLVHWVGFEQRPIVYDRSLRVGGQSSANLIYCVKFAIHAIFCFSSKPLDLAMISGGALTILSLLLAVLYGVLFFVRPVFLNPPPPGITTILLLMLFGLGSQSLFMGIIGKYVGRIYNQGKGRPVYIADKTIGFDGIAGTENSINAAPRWMAEEAPFRSNESSEARDSSRSNARMANLEAQS